MERAEGDTVRGGALRGRGFRYTGSGEKIPQMALSSPSTGGGSAPRPLLWLRAVAAPAASRGIVGRHLEHLAGLFQADGWRVHEGTETPGLTEFPGLEAAPPLLAVLDDPWIEAVPAAARALGRAVAPSSPLPGSLWRVPRLRGAPGPQGWQPRRGPYTLSAVRQRAVASGRLEIVEGGSDPGFAVATGEEAPALLAGGWPPAATDLGVVRSVRLYRYDDPADHERRELDPFVPATAQVVVDVGCGHGRLGERLRQAGRRVIGIEPDPDMARLAEGRLDQVLAIGAEEALPALASSLASVTAGPVDCFVFADVLEHVPDPARVLRLAAEVLAAEGRMVVSVPNTAWAPVLRDLAAGRWEPTLAGVQARDHLTPFTRDSLRRLAGECGLEVETCVPLAAPLPWSIRFWAWWVAWSAGGRSEDLLAPQWIAVLRHAPSETGFSDMAP